MILKRFKLQMTDRQFGDIHEAWMQHGSAGRSIICQPHWDGQGNQYFSCAILDEGASIQINELLHKTQQVEKEGE